MLAIEGTARRLCDGVARRAFLRAGAIAGLGLGLPDLLRPSRAAGPVDDPTFGRAKRCILLFPFGGPSQIDTFDPKPDAPAEIRGEFRPIATALPGVSFTELFPELASLTDRLAIVRSLTHGDANHTTAGYTLLTGVPHPRANDPAGGVGVKPTAEDRPHVGSVLAALRPSAGPLPPFVAVPEVVHDAGVNEVPGQGPGFLGGAFAPLLFEANAGRDAFPPPDAFAPAGLDPVRIDARRALHEQVDRRLAGLDRDGRFAALEAHYARAYDLLRTPAARRAFDLAAEPTREREAYGPHLFAQGCLLARRLIEAGVSLVTVYWHYEGPEDSPCWDTHANNFKHLRERLAPPADRAVARLLRDLESRGLLDETLVVWVGEFGRKPYVNKNAGREHWPQVQTALLAGGGIARGIVHGASDRAGGHPANAPVTPGDLGATILHLLGVRPETELRDRLGRPFPAAAGLPIRELFG